MASANALASCLVPVPRARIHAEIRRAGAFGQRGGTRLLRNTRGGAMPLVHGPHRVKSSIIEPLRTRLSTPHSYGRCARQTRQRRARGHLHPEVVPPSNAAAVPDARARGACGQARVWVTVAASANALASCLVSMPRARIHAEIRRAGAFGQRGGTRLLRHTRGGAMPLVRGPQPPKRIVAGRSRTSVCARPMRCRAADRGFIADASRALLTLLTDTMMNGQVRGGYTK